MTNDTRDLVGAAKCYILMIACVERRFDAIRTPHPIQWLSDNGSVYAAAKTIELASARARTLLHADREPREQRHCRSLRDDLQA